MVKLIVSSGHSLKGIDCPNCKDDTFHQRALYVYCEIAGNFGSARPLRYARLSSLLRQQTSNQSGNTAFSSRLAVNNPMNEGHNKWYIVAGATEGSQNRNLFTKKELSVYKTTASSPSCHGRERGPLKSLKSRKPQPLEMAAARDLDTADYT